MDGPPETTNPPEVGASEGSRGQSGGHRLGHKDTKKRREDYARERYALHGQIRRILIAEVYKSHAGKHPGNIYRTAACTWVRVDDVTLVKPADRDSYHYKGLVTCGSVHTCPLCAPKIQERRREEVAQAFLVMADKGKSCVLGSFTFPHRVDQPLSLLLELQRQALAHMRGTRAYKKLMQAIGAAGRIRALEVTHGLNGWHPHTHELIFCDPGVHEGWLRHELAVLWLKSCRKVGLFVEGRDNEEDFHRYSVDVQVGDEAVTGYLVKLDDQRTWDLSHELTKSSSKQGKRSGVHPFRLASEPRTHGLFLEYADAMKGSRQLVWSRGLKAEVGIVDKSDEELAQEETARAVDRIGVAHDAWRVVLGNDARWELVEAARRGGAPAVGELLQVLGWKPTDGSE